jgi:hypothetical protein
MCSTLIRAQRPIFSIASITDRSAAGVVDYFSIQHDRIRVVFLFLIKLQPNQQRSDLEMNIRSSTIAR